MNKDLKKIITRFSVFAMPILIWIGLLIIVDPFNYFQLNNFITIKSKEKTGKNESDVIKIMRKNLKPSSFRLWRKRVHNTSIKHRKKFKLERKKLREKIKITDIN